MGTSFISQRHIIDTLGACARLRGGSTVGVISPLDGAGWQSNIPLLRRLPSRTTRASRWSVGLRKHDGRNTNVVSKQAVNL